MFSYPIPTVAFGLIVLVTMSSAGVSFNKYKNQKRLGALTKFLSLSKVRLPEDQQEHQ